MKRFPRPVQYLLVTSLLLSLSKAITLPFLAIYLCEALGLSTDAAGYILGGSLFLGTLSSVYGGYVVDRWRKDWTLFGSITVVGALFLVLPSVHRPFVMVTLLSATYAAFSLCDVCVKTSFASLLEQGKRLEAFSWQYRLRNIGFALGPLMGAVLAGRDSRLPFWIAGSLALLVLVGVANWRRVLFPVPPAAPLTDPALRAAHDFRTTWRILRRDKCLILLALAGIFGALVHARFAAYLSQYLVRVSAPDHAYHTIASIVAVNACVVICLQHRIGARIARQHLLRWMMAGLFLFLIGLLAFMSSTWLPVWIVAAMLFSLGEMIVAPAAYLFIDLIAPERLKGSYYAVQNLSDLGAAVSPVLCGVLLAQTAPQMMFLALMLATLASAGFYYLGHRRMSSSEPGSLAPVQPRP